MTYYVAVLRDNREPKRELLAIYAYGTTSEVAFRENMKFHYGHVMNETNTKIYTNANEFFSELDGELEDWLGKYVRNKMLACMRGDSTDHFAVNFSVYRDKL